MTASGLKLAEKRLTRGVKIFENDVGRDSLDPSFGDPCRELLVFSIPLPGCGSGRPDVKRARLSCKLLPLVLLLLPGCDCPSSIGCTPTVAVDDTRLFICGALEQRLSAFGESTSILQLTPTLNVKSTTFAKREFSMVFA